MCLGSISLLVDSWDADGVHVGRLDTGAVVSLAFVPEARPGSHVIVHLGIPVEVIDREEAATALALRTATGGTS
jgi:hydrogenase expression/formation protein HypC